MAATFSRGNARVRTAAVFLIAATHLTRVAYCQERDIPYGPDPTQRLDLFVPTNRSFATVLFVHGGSFTSGDKRDEDYERVCSAIITAGVGCAGMNYGLAPAYRWPRQALDVVAAIAWIRHNIGSRGGDSAAIFLMGHSSGAMLVALVGADPRYLEQEGLSLNSVRGIIAMGSIMRDVEIESAIERLGTQAVTERFAQDPANSMFNSLADYLNTWPIRHIRAGLPPYLFLIAESEQEHPPVLATNREFADRARALGNWAEYRVLPGRGHYTAIRQLGDKSDTALPHIQSFVERFRTP